MSTWSWTLRRWISLLSLFCLSARLSYHDRGKNLIRHSVSLVCIFILLQPDVSFHTLASLFLFIYDLCCCCCLCTDGHMYWSVDHVHDCHESAVSKGRFLHVCSGFMAAVVSIVTSQATSSSETKHASGPHHVMVFLTFVSSLSPPGPRPSAPLPHPGPEAAAVTWD